MDKLEMPAKPLTDSDAKCSVREDEINEGEKRKHILEIIQNLRYIQISCNEQMR